MKMLRMAESFFSSHQDERKREKERRAGDFFFSSMRRPETGLGKERGSTVGIGNVAKDDGPTEERRITLQHEQDIPFLSWVLLSIRQRQKTFLLVFCRLSGGAKKM